MVEGQKDPEKTLEKLNKKKVVEAVPMTLTDSFFGVWWCFLCELLYPINGTNNHFDGYDGTAEDSGKQNVDRVEERFSLLEDIVLQLQQLRKEPT